MRYKKTITLTLTIIILFLCVRWIQAQSILVLEKPNSASGVSYAITKSGEVSNTKSTSLDKTTNVWLHSGTYMVTVTSKEGSYVSIVATQHFFHKTIVTPQLQPQAKRTFVADNPNPCMYVAGENIYSSECMGDASDIVQHIRSNATSPAYTQKISTLPSATLAGVATTSSGETIVAVLGQADNTYNIYKVDAAFQPIGMFTYAPPSPKGSYSIKPYLDGFAVFSNQSSTVTYFKSFDTQPEILKIESAHDSKKTSIASIDVQPAEITVVYTSQNNTTTTDAADSESGTSLKLTGDQTSEVVMLSGGTYTHAALDSTPLVAIPCDTNKVCTYAAHTLTIYRLRGEHTKSYFTLKGVNAINAAGTSIRVVTDTTITSFPQSLSAGHRELALNGYRVTDLSVTGNTYILSVVDKLNNKKALLVTSDQVVDDTLDTLLPKLEDPNLITSVSANYNFIYIVPNYGEISYNPATNLNTYDPARVRRVNQQIQILINESGIDTSKYTIISTGYTP